MGAASECANHDATNIKQCAFALFFSAEGLDVSQVPLRPRGRPSGRFFLSMMPGSGGTGGQEQATDLSLNSQQPANLSLGNNNNNHVVATDLSLSNNEEATDLTVNNNNHQEMEMEENSDGNMSTPDLQVCM